jgi:hypothetical protein
MQAHKDQFEDHLVRKARSGPMRLPLDGQLNKVRNGQVGESKEVVPDHIKEELDRVWQTEITEKIGLKTYDDLRKELAN